MEKTALTFDRQLSGLLQQMAQSGMARAAEGLAGMLGEPVQVTQPAARLVPLAELPALLGGPENEAVAIYVQAEGELCGQFMLVLPYPKALELADLLMELPAGTTQQLGRLERSALAEVGNITATFFLNEVAKGTGLDGRPTPPAVMVDMVGAILDVVAAVCGGVSESVLMLQAAFLRQQREVDVDFWVIPDPATLDAVRQTGTGKPNA
jgi:chemotaxis protein CheC